MITKKLLVPFINEKILNNAEHCYIATAAISEPAFDLLMSKLPPKCKLSIVTGLDQPTHPNVLIKALNQYPNRITFRISTKNFFHPNVFIFDLPFRKMVAFIGSAPFTMGGFKDHEELSYKLDSEKSVEEVKTWFRSYFEYAEDLSESIIYNYQEIYPSMVEREATSKIEKKEFTELITSPFNWETAKLTGQFFQEEDYKTFEARKVSINSMLVKFEREQVQTKLLALHEQILPFLQSQKLQAIGDSGIVSSPDPIFYPEHKVKEMWLTYGKEEKRNIKNSSIPEQFCFQIRIRRNDVSIILALHQNNQIHSEKDAFLDFLKIDENRKKFFDLVKGLVGEYWMEITGEKQSLSSLKNADQFLEIIDDDFIKFYIKVGRTFLPVHPELSSEKIQTTIQEEIKKLFPLYNYMSKAFTEKEA